MTFEFPAQLTIADVGLVTVIVGADGMSVNVDTLTGIESAVSDLPKTPRTVYVRVEPIAKLLNA